MKTRELIKSILRKSGWRLVRTNNDYGLDSFFPLLKRYGFAPRHIVDIGANHGSWTRKALQSFPNSDYTLVEPQDHLKEHVRDLLNQGYKLHWVNAGAGDRSDTLPFNIASRDDGSTFVQTSNDDSATNQAHVSVMTLNEIVASSGRPIPDMVKIDAEGFDLKVLTGASDLFGKTEIFLIEAVICAPLYENTLQEVVRRMSDAGYKVMDITDLIRSPTYGVLWLCELAFIRKDSTLLGSATIF